MKEQLIKLLGLDDKADEAAILKAVATLKAALNANKPSQRELAILQKMQITGMPREQAEHVIDQQAKEDAFRNAQAKTSSKGKNNQ